MPVVAEVWTCAKTHLPVLTKISGSFGTQTSVCKTAQTAEPHPATFQIPPGYKQLS
jgi:3-deoxy-D-arabino-heptulosonate 7-phosphate (DAHP) synthase